MPSWYHTTTMTTWTTQRSCRSRRSTRMYISLFHSAIKSGFTILVSRKSRSSTGGKRGTLHYHPRATSLVYPANARERQQPKELARETSMHIFPAFHANILVPGQLLIEDIHCGHLGAFKAAAKRSGSEATRATGPCLNYQKAKTTTVQTSTTHVAQPSSR